MAVYVESSVAHLRGDLTLAGMTSNIINSLSVTLQTIVSGGDKNIHIDCKCIRTADISGLKLLFVWMQSARFRGVEPDLFNLPISLQQRMKKLGFWGRLTSNRAYPEALALFPVR